MNKLKIKKDLILLSSKSDITIEELITECQLEDYYLIAKNQFITERLILPSNEQIISRILGHCNEKDLLFCEAKTNQLLPQNGTAYNIFSIDNSNSININISNHLEIKNAIQTYDKSANKKSKIESCINILTSLLNVIPGIKPAVNIIKEVLELFQADES